MKGILECWIPCAVTPRSRCDEDGRESGRRGRREREREREREEEEEREEREEREKIERERVRSHFGSSSLRT